MRYLRKTAVLILLAFLPAQLSWAKARPKHHSTSANGQHKTSAKSRKASAKSSKSKSQSKKGKKSWQAKGQKTITNERTREIQEALIRDGYLSGQPSGMMDSSTKDALVRMQQKNGWQTKIVPDARALIKLGLGPSQANLLNPDTAAVSGNLLLK